MNLEPFESKYIPEIVCWVRPIWTMVDWEESVSTVDWDADSAEKPLSKKQDLDVEFIVRHNIFSNEFALQLVEGEKLLAVAFAARKDEENDALQWLEENSGGLSPRERTKLQQVVEYLEQMDEKTCSFMEKDAIRLTLFASGLPGFGHFILAELEKRLRCAGFKSLYLWTDSDCNYQWYPRHGFTLVEAEGNEAFSTPQKNFMTCIFRKQL